MPTQIQFRTRPSRVAEAIAALMLSLLAAVIDGTIICVIVWAYD